MAAKRGMTRRQFLRGAGVAAAGLVGAGVAAKLAVNAARNRGARVVDWTKRFKDLRFIVSSEELARLTVRHGFTESEALTFNTIQGDLIAKGEH
ncbi:MAG: twin-arginine translocation signal domain-containing protein [Candidatus Diapherotrites archaeon]|nr:twin-arginine translocation signal domain-containing protein [Candidatus Diapherotrites archaeon]